MSVHGHNLEPMITSVDIAPSADFGSTYAIATSLTIKRPAFCFPGSTSNLRYGQVWKVTLAGTPHEAPWIGEIVLGQGQACATSPQWGFPKTRNFQGPRQRGPSARLFAYNYADDPPEDIELTFSPRSTTTINEVAEAIWLRSGQGVYPTIIVPIDTETAVYYGRLMQPSVVKRPFQNVYETVLALSGDPFPTFGA